MPYRSNTELPEAVRELPEHAQTIFRSAFNAAMKEYEDEDVAFAVAWAAVKRVYRQIESGEWVRKSGSRTREFKSFPFEYQADETRIVEGHAAIFGNIDSGNGFFKDTIHQGAFKDALANPEHKRRIRYLWNHDLDLPPLGPILAISEDSTGLYFKARLTEGVHLSDQLYRLLRDNALDELSIGFVPDDWNMEEVPNVGTVRHLKRITPFDVSHVNFGMNLAAQVMSVKSWGYSNMDYKGAIPFHSYPLADIDTPWDAGPEIKDATPEELMRMCAWYDSENPDLRGSYKLPHHTRSGYKTVWRAVANAMARLMQGNTDIPEVDRKGVYNHLARHYKEFGKEPPEFKTDVSRSAREIRILCGDYTTLDFVTDALRELKSGDILTNVGAGEVWEVFRQLRDVLDSSGYCVPEVPAKLLHKATKAESGTNLEDLDLRKTKLLLDLLKVSKHV